MIKIIIDSVSGLSQKEAIENGFEFLPIAVINGDKKYDDGVDIDKSWVLTKQKEGAILKTSQPATQLIEDKVVKCSQNKNGLLVISVSSKISGTYDAVDKIAEKFKNVKVLDSANGGYAMVVLANMAKKLAKTESLKKVVDKLEKSKSDLFTYVVPHDLTYLVRSGRASAAIVKFAKIIGIVPLLHLDETGAIQKMGKARSLKKSISKIFKHSQNKLTKVAELAILLHGQNKEEKTILKQLVEEIFGIKTVFKSIPTAVAVHIGPKSFGLTISKFK